MRSTVWFPRDSTRLSVMMALLLVCLFACAEREQPATRQEPEIDLATAAQEATEPSSPMSAATRDWNRCPAIADVPAQGDLLVVGDVHGDWEMLRDLLLGAEVISSPSPAAPREATWSAGNATLLFVGDFTGKFPQALDVIELIQRLGAQAEAEGGRVIATLGNHEAEFLAPKGSDHEPRWAKKTASFRKELEKAGLDPREVWLAQGDERSRRLGEFLHCLPAAAVSEHWFFSHAGSTGGRTLEALRREIEQGVRADGYRTAVLLDEADGLLEARLSPDPPADIWWQRLPESQKKSRKRLEKYAEALGVRHFAIGHQSGKYTFNRDIVRKKARVFQLFDGALYLVDVGMSRGQHGGQSAGALLHIERRGQRQSVSVVCPDGRRRPLPPEGTSKGLKCKLP